MEYIGENQVRHSIDNIKIISDLNREHYRKEGTLLFKEASSVIGPRWICIRVHMKDDGSYYIVMRKRDVRINIKLVDHNEFKALRLLPIEAYGTYIASLVGD